MAIPLVCLAALVILIVTTVTVADRASELRCLVCENLIVELDNEVRKVNPKAKLDLGSMNSGKKKYYYRSETHLTDAMDDICNNFEHYAEATYKETGERTIIRFLDEKGQMHTDMSKVDFAQTEDLNKGLKFYCHMVLEENEDKIFDSFLDDRRTLSQLTDHICHVEGPCSWRQNLKKQKATDKKEKATDKKEEL